MGKAAQEPSGGGQGLLADGGGEGEELSYLEMEGRRTPAFDRSCHD